MPNLNSKFNENMIYADDRNWTDEHFLTADQCKQNPCNGEPDWLNEPRVVFDREAEAAHKVWQESLSYLHENH